MTCDEGLDSESVFKDDKFVLCGYSLILLKVLQKCNGESIINFSPECLDIIFKGIPNCLEYRCDDLWEIVCLAKRISKDIGNQEGIKVIDAHIQQ